MKNRPDGRLKGDVSMGCSALRPERVGAAIWGLLSGLRSMGCGLRGFRGRDIDPQDQKMAVPLGVRQRRGNRMRKARRSEERPVGQGCDSTVKYRGSQEQ